MSTVIENPTREAWLESRRTSGVGGSESAAALGQNDYKSRYELWAEKCGLVEPDDLSTVRRVRLGLKMEPIIAEEFEIETGRPVKLWPQYQMLRHADYPFMTCTLDAEQECPERGKGILQMKAPGYHQRGNWEGAPPLMYQIQLQHEMAVSGARWGSLCALIDGEIYYHDFNYDERFVNAMVPHLAEFWAAVQSRQAPAIDASESCRKALAKMYPTDNGTSIMLPDESVAWDADLREIKAKISNLEIDRDLLENQLKAAIGDATYGMLPNGEQYSYKSQTRKSYVVKESSFRVLRRLK